MSPFNVFKNKKKPMSSPAGTIIPIASGKGGVGKSFVSSNLAIALAELGHRVIAVDLDFGGANLYSFLGLSNRHPGVGDFLKARIAELDELLVPSGIPNLHFLPGDGKTPFMANIAHTQKIKLISRLKKLPADYILLDLSAGSSFNTLDFFLSADEGILVVLPEPTSVENAYHFIKAAFYRKLKKATRKTGVAEAIDKAMEEKVARGIQSPRALINNVLQMNPEAGHALEEEARSFKPNIIVNQTRKHDDHELGGDIVLACLHYFGINIRNLGHIDEDDALKEAVRQRRAVVDAFPVSPFTGAIHSIVKNLLDTRNLSENPSDS